MQKQLFIRVVRAGRPAKGMKVYASTVQLPKNEITNVAETDEDGFAIVGWMRSQYLATIYINDVLVAKGRFYNGQSKLIAIEQSPPNGK